MSSNDLLLILDVPGVHPRDIDQFYRIWRSDAARYRALVAGPPIVHPLPPDVPVNKGKRTASAAFDSADDDGGPGGALKRRTSSGWDLGGKAVRGLVHSAATMYYSLVPASWSSPSQDTDTNPDDSHPAEASTSGLETNTPTWEYQTVARKSILIPSDTQGLPEEPEIIPQSRATPLHTLLQNAIDSPELQSSAVQAPQTVFFPKGALPPETDLEDMNAILMLLSGNSVPPVSFEKGLARPNDFLYAAKMRLWPPNSREHDDLLPWTFLDYALTIDTCEALLCFLAHDFSKIDIGASPDEIDDVTVVGFSKSQDGSTFEYRNVLPEAPLERVEGKAHVVSLDGASLLIRRWNDALKVPFVPHTWRWMQSEEQSDEERMTLPRVLAYAVDSKTAALRFDGKLGLAVPGYKGPWEAESLGVEPCHQVTFWDALCQNAPRNESHLEFTIRLLFPLPKYEARARNNVRSFIYFGKELPCVARHEGTEHHPIFSAPIPVVPNTRVQGRFDLWTVRLLAITLLVPPGDTSPNWTPIRIDMPNGGIRAILDTASLHSTLPPTAIKSMCDRWFGLGDDQSQADSEKLSDHDLVFTFEDTDGAPVDFRYDAAYFLSRLWEEDRRGPDLFCWSHVRSSNDEESDIAVLGMNFFWGAFVKFSAPYHGSDTVPSVQFAAQRAVVDGQKIFGPWDFAFPQ